MLEIVRLACPEVAVVAEPVDQWLKMIEPTSGKHILQLFYEQTERFA